MGKYSNNPTISTFLNGTFYTLRATFTILCTCMVTN